MMPMEVIIQYTCVSTVSPKLRCADDHALFQCKRITHNMHVHAVTAGCPSMPILCKLPFVSRTQRHRSLQQFLCICMQVIRSAQVVSTLASYSVASYSLIGRQDSRCYDSRPEQPQVVADDNMKLDT